MVDTEPAYAKLNLTLDVLGPRPDGYHDMRMVMQSVDLTDSLSVAERDRPGISVCTDLRYLPRDEGNLAVKAAVRFFEGTGLPKPGLSITLAKRIPVCAGMAGGSSDAAAMLRLLRRAYAPGLTGGQLEALGAQVGSDVPYCVRGGAALAEGRGELLTELPPLPPCWFVVCKPPFSISTPELFACIRGRRLRCHPDTAGVVAALGQGDLEGVAVRLYNVFEEVLPRRFAAVFELKGRLLELGAMAASMTGSGPAVFGLFRTEDAAHDAWEALCENSLKAFLCRPTGRLPL